MATFDFIKFQKKIVESSDNSSVRKKAINLAQERVQKAKEEMIAEFDNHAVTREIQGGPNAENISNTLNGDGNLFSYIGFNEGENPTEVVRDYLNESTALRRTYDFNVRKGLFTFKVKTPSLEEVEQKTPFPWEPRSWVRGVERGISGLGFYISSKIKEFKNSRSGVAIQSKKKIRTGSYKAIKYLSEIIRNFRKKL
jgi:hypothetical protein